MSNYKGVQAQGARPQPSLWFDFSVQILYLMKVWPPTWSPSFAMQYVRRRTTFLMPSARNVFARCIHIIIT